MLKKVINNEKGAALVVTIAVMAVLVATALGVRKITLNAFKSGQQVKDLFHAEQTALSGINLASLILVQDAQNNAVDSLQEEWADDEWIQKAVGELGYNEGALTLKITDELSKIQVNALLKAFPGNEINEDQRRIFEKLLGWALPEDDENIDSEMVINRMKDWMDSLDDDTVTGISGAESDYYLNLEPSYECANGPLNHIDELFLIKGVSQDIFKVNGDTEDGKDPLPLNFDDVLTVFGLGDETIEGNKYYYSGKVNINTAPLSVISAILPVGMEAFAQDLVDFRTQKGEKNIDFINALDKGWYKRVIDLPKDEQNRFEQTISYESNLYRVQSIAKENSAKIELVAYLKREKQKNTGKWICRTIRLERKY